MSIISAMGGADPAQRMEELQKKAQENFDAADTNKDGTVSTTEFTEAMSAQGIETTKAAEAFSVLDANGDGEVTQKEHDQVMQGMQERMTAMMAKMQDGMLDYAVGGQEQESQFDSLKAMLSAIASDTNDKDTSNRLNELLAQMETEGYSKQGVQRSVELLNKVAPPVNTTA